MFQQGGAGAVDPRSLTVLALVSRDQPGPVIQYLSWGL